MSKEIPYGPFPSILGLTGGKAGIARDGTVVPGGVAVPAGITPLGTL
jgi:hypothetical protein